MDHGKWAISAASVRHQQSLQPMPPRHTPKKILEQLRAALLQVLAHADLREAMAEQATEVTTNTPEEFRQLVRNELLKYGDVVKSVGLKAD